mgnify:CR=1 FL=1
MCFDRFLLAFESLVDLTDLTTLVDGGVFSFASTSQNFCLSKDVIHCNPVQGRTGSVQGSLCFENRFPAM